MKKRVALVLVGIILSMFLFTACGSEKNQNKTNDTQQADSSTREINKISGVSFSVPQIWKDSEENQNPFNNVNDIIENAYFTFDENGTAAVFSMNIPSGTDGVGFVSALEKEMLDNIEVKEEDIENVFVSSREVKRVSFLTTQSGVEMYRDVTIATNGDKAFVFVFSNLANTREETAKVVKTVIKSIKFD